MRSIDTKSTIEAVDLFCGAGGLSFGLQDEGIRVKAGIDFEPACRYPYEANIAGKFIEKSVEDVTGDDISPYFALKDGYSLLAGCAPCQTFSQYNAKAAPDDARWTLLDHFRRLIEETIPDFVTMENVPGLEEHSVFEKFLHTLSDLEYWVDFQQIDCTDYGLAQTRSRLVLVASKHAPIHILSPEEFGETRKTVRQVIGSLPLLAAGETHATDPLHSSSALSAKNMARMKASRPNGTWRDWPQHLQADCHRKDSGRSYPSVYGRMSWDAPSPTITTQFYGFGNGRFGHPEQDRALSLREGALLQGFPKSYRFAAPGCPVPRRIVGRMIGNAVPVTLGRMIAKTFLFHIQTLNHCHETTIKTEAQSNFPNAGKAATHAR